MRARKHAQTHISYIYSCIYTHVCAPVFLQVCMYIDANIHSFYMYAGDSEHLCCIQREAGKVSRMKPVTINMMHAYIYTCQQAHTHTHIHTYTLAHVHMVYKFCSCVCVHLCLRACMYMPAYLRVYSHARVCLQRCGGALGRAHQREGE